MQMTLTEKALTLNKKINGWYLELGELLQEIRDKELYKDEYDNFSYFVQDLKMTEGTASKIITVFHEYVEEYKISKEKLSQVGSWSILYKVRKLIKNKKDAADWIDKIIVLTSTDLKREMDELITGQSMQECVHEWQKYRKCKICHLNELDYE